MFQTTSSQTVAGGVDQFDGAAGSGLFSFDYASLPNTDQIIVDRIGLFGPTTTATAVEVWWQSGANRILIGTADAASLLTPTGDLAATWCPGRVPRNPDRSFWEIIVISGGLAGPCTATISWSRGTP